MEASEQWERENFVCQKTWRSFCFPRESVKAFVRVINYVGEHILRVLKALAAINLRRCNLEILTKETFFLNFSDEVTLKPARRFNPFSSFDKALRVGFGEVLKSDCRKENTFRVECFPSFAL